MNIKYQVSGLVLLLVITYFYRRQPDIGLKSAKVFFRVLVGSFLCLVMDIASIIFICNQDVIPEFWVNVVCKLYLSSLTAIGYIGFYYAFYNTPTFKKKQFFVAFDSILAISNILIWVLPINVVYESKEVLYTEGPACIVTYLTACMMIVATTVYTFFNKSTQNRKRDYAIRTWMFIWILAALVQFFVPRLLLVGFASAIGVMILFFTLENPESNLDKKYGLFNYRVLVELMDQKYDEKKDFSLVAINMNSEYVDGVSANQLTAAFDEITKYLVNKGGRFTFKNIQREFIILFDDKSVADELVADLNARFSAGFSMGDYSNRLLKFRPLIMLIRDSEIAKNGDSILDLITYAKGKYIAAFGDNIIEITAENIKEKDRAEEIENIITDAMRDDRIEVFLQPIFNVASSKFTSAEALVRIRNLDGSLLPPGEFIPVAEASGLMEDLGERIFEKTCIFLEENDLSEYSFSYVEANLSVVQCESDELAETYIDIIEDHHLHPEYFNLEITESAAVLTKEKLIRNMQRLQKEGISFSLDDFGSGHSNLNYLVDLPVKILKYDMEMTKAYFANEKARLVVVNTTNLAHEMGIRVVAEGVETKEEFEELVRVGVDYIQGYYFSKPMPGNEFVAFIKEKNGKQK